jgi:Icc-related predicted phosphoesterase
MKKLVAISDTHSLHKHLTIPKCDMLIHAGDFTGNGCLNHLMDFAKWMSQQPAKYKIVVAGNHDEIAEKSPDTTLTVFKEYGIIYLCNNEVIIDGIKIFGSPYTPMFCNWHFMMFDDDLGYEVWDKIPLDTNILITHGPMYGALDYVASSYGSHNCGSKSLANKMSELLDLKYHIFGHIHYSYGQKNKHFNVSSCNEGYTISNKPVELNY